MIQNSDNLQNLMNGLIYTINHSGFNMFLQDYRSVV